MILERELKGISGPLRLQFEEQITKAIRESTGAYLDRRPETMEHLHLTILKSIAKIKSIIEPNSVLDDFYRESVPLVHI